MGRTVLITGASTGIGAACADHLAQRGWTVFAGVRRVEDGERLASAIAGDVRPVRLDVRDDDQIAEAVASVRDAVGPLGLDGLVNNAGIGLAGPVELVPSDTWRSQIEVNLLGSLAVTRAAFPLLRTAAGRIVFMGSQAGRVSMPMLAPYAASKHALVAVCDSLRLELRASPMQVSLIEPGSVKTPIWDKSTEEDRRIRELLAASGRHDYDHLMPAVRGAITQAQQAGVPSSRVATRVEHALTAARPRARYLVGPDAWLLGGLVARLPVRLRDAAVAVLVRVTARAGRDRPPSQGRVSGGPAGTGTAPGSR